ncbi:MAG: ParA family protein [Candidatus Pacebacteria bacterium]|nr:ParA family protein [Candidatus Paceibacterota bacterium]
MSVIVFASSKGGCGKSTSALLLSTELAYRGLKVTLIDADPNAALLGWQDDGGKAENLNIIPSNEANILSDIEKSEKESDFVIVDLEGSANLCVAYAMSLSDLVIIPAKRSKFDSKETIKTLNLVAQQSKAIGRKISYSVLMTQTHPSVRSEGLRATLDSLTKNKINYFHTEIYEREVLRLIVDKSTTLRDLKIFVLKPHQMIARKKALENSADFAAEVLEKIANLSKKKSTPRKAVKKKAQAKNNKKPAAKKKTSAKTTKSKRAA